MQQQQQQFMHMMQMMLNSKQAQTQVVIELLKKGPPWYVKKITTSGVVILDVKRLSFTVYLESSSRIAHAELKKQVFPDRWSWGTKTLATRVVYHFP